MSPEREAALEAVAASRRRVEQRMKDLRAAVGHETGVVPKAKYTLLALAAGAVGATLAARRHQRKRLR